jgi:hypothetical protein
MENTNLDIRVLFTKIKLLEKGLMQLTVHVSIIAQKMESFLKIEEGDLGRERV